MTHGKFLSANFVGR